MLQIFQQAPRSQQTAKALSQSSVQAIRNEFENAELPGARRENLSQAYSFIPSSPALEDKDFLIQLIDGIENNVNAFMRTHKYYDTVGEFYIEFLRFANNDKGLGIVLTPPHIAQLFAKIAEVGKNSIVFDNCCGTASLLISAMRTMVRDASASKEVESRIKNSQLYGIEFQPNI